MNKLTKVFICVLMLFGLSGCSKGNNGKSETSSTFKSNGEIKEILSKEGWKSKCSADHCYLDNGSIKIAKNEDYSKIKNSTSLSDAEITNFLDWMNMRKEQNILQDDEWASEEDKISSNRHESNNNNEDSNKMEPEQKVDTEGFVKEIRNKIQGSIASNEYLNNISLYDKELVIEIDLSQTDPSPLTIEELAISRTSSITDPILKLTEYYDLWEVITVDFGETGKISNNKDDIQENGYGGYYFPTSNFVLK